MNEEYRKKYAVSTANIESFKAAVSAKDDHSLILLTFGAELQLHIPQLIDHRMGDDPQSVFNVFCRLYAVMSDLNDRYGDDTM